MKKIYLNPLKILILVLLASFYNASSQTFGTCLNLNGTSNYVTAPNTANALEPANLTFECWVKKKNTGFIFGKDRLMMSINNNGWGVLLEATAIKLTKVGVSEVSSTGTINDTLWHHIAVTHNGTLAKFYIDGNFDSQKNYTVSFASTGNYSFGSRGNSEFLTGKIDEFRVWSKVKTAAEIANEYCMELTGNEAGLIAYYKMNEGTGTIVGDATPSANTANITNGTNLWVTSTATCSSIGINEINKSIIHKAFPNPTFNDINILFAQEMSGAKYSIINSVGAEVMNGEIMSKETNVNLTNLPAGIYFLQVNKAPLKETIKVVKLQ